MANSTLHLRLTPTASLEDHVLISRLGRAVETDPQVTIEEEDMDREKAASFYKPHPNESFIELGKGGLKTTEDPYELFLKDALHRAWGIKVGDLQEMLKEKSDLGTG